MLSKVKAASPYWNFAFFFLSSFLVRVTKATSGRKVLFWLTVPVYSPSKRRFILCRRLGSCYIHSQEVVDDR